MSQIIRAFGAVVDDVDASERSVVAKISAGDIDRHRTIISSSGVKFENYRKNPVVLFEHGKSIQRGSLPIGRNIWIKSDGKGTGRILAKTRFADDDFSQLLFSFYKDGTMRGWSISILPEEASVPSRDEIRSRSELKDCELIYRASDLLEYSAVSVPSCASALSDPELRSLSTLVVRGFWAPSEEVKPLVDPIVERMSESNGMADGGALVDDDGDDEEDDGDDEKTKKKKKKKKDDAKDDEKDRDADADAEDGEVDECYGSDAKPMRSVDEPNEDEDEAAELVDEVARDAEEVESVDRDGFNPDEPSDSRGRWTDAGSDPDKSKIERRKRGIKKNDDDDTYDHPKSLTKRLDAIDRLQKKYDKTPLYQTHPVVEKSSGEVLVASVSKNASHHGFKSGKKYVVNLWGSQSKHELDREETNDLQKAAKLAGRMQKNLLSDKGFSLAPRSLDELEETVDRTNPEAAVETEAVPADPVEELTALIRRAIQEGRVSLDEFHAAPEPVAPEPTPEPAVEPEPVDPFDGLPTFTGRSFPDVYVRRNQAINAWLQTMEKMVRDFADWRRGKA